ncbi:MAG: LysE family transporter [Marinovum sp.]|nr:LysE family transporter [Marinovum sp.]
MVGLLAIVAATSVLSALIKDIGAAYLIYFGLRALFDRVPADLRQGRLPIFVRRSYRSAILVQVLNPKAALSFLASTP